MTPKTLPLSLLILVFLSSSLFGGAQIGNIPVTKQITFDFLPKVNPYSPQPAPIPVPVNPVKSEKPGLLTSVSVPNVMDLPVEQQPNGSPVYVSTNPETITQFGMASQYGTIGLLAHNNLAGSNFFHLQLRETVNLVYGNGQTKTYKVSSIKQYQALSPDSPYSDFIDLENPGVILSSADVFNQVYRGANQVVFQTCIARDGQPSWGRLFITATPVQPIPENSYFWLRLWRNAYMN